jgi:glycosyltransferase involved in cell wall biosynthesis
MEKEEPLVSVVTPVYNGERYLVECIESVLAQQYQHWEYIILDNCSEDGSLEIAQRYAASDSRIKVYRNSSVLPIMQNWNNALRKISPESKYCKVVHADDWLFPNCIRQMLDVAEGNSSVSLVGSYRLDEDRVNLDDLPYSGSIFTGREICRRRLLGGRDLFGSPSSLMYRSDIVRSRDNFYNEDYIHADTEVCFDILQDSDFGFVYQVLSYTRRHNESVSSFSTMVNTHKFNHLYIALKYGPKYLDDQEFARVIKKEFKVYYRFLGKKLLKLIQRRQWSGMKKFWKYHLHALNKIGYPLSVIKFIGSTLVVLYNESLRSISVQ